MADDFGYINARVRARRSALLPEAFFQEALLLSFPDFLRSLGETPYGGDLAGESLESVDRAVSAQLQKRVADLPRLASGDAQRALELMLMRSDLNNLKTILRAKGSGLRSEEVKAQLMTGTLPESLLSGLIEAPDAASMAQILTLPGHPLARALREAVRQTQEPLRLEVELDKAFFAALSSISKRLGEPFLASYVGTEVDSVNIATAFKLQVKPQSGPASAGAQGQNANPTEYFVPGGRFFPLPQFLRLAEGDYAVLDEMGNTPFAPLSGARDLTEAERRLRTVLRDRAESGQTDPLGAGLALSFIKAKEWEAQRIRLLARRAYYGLPVEAVEKEVRA